MPSEAPSPGASGWEVPLCEPRIGEEEAELLGRCAESGWVSSAGSFVGAFEGLVAERLDVEHAVATVSGTAALHVALRASGVREADAVLVSTLSFVAPANAVRYLGAHPVFVDAEPDHWQLDPELVRGFFEERCERRDGEVVDGLTGRRVAALLPVHVLGHPVDFDALAEIAREWGVPIVEDAAESLGASYRGRPVGSLGDAACLSFNGNKVVTAGSGGMVVTDDGSVAEKVRYLTTQAKDDPVEYVHREIGYNYRLTNVHAAIGYAQLGRLDRHVEAKRRIARRYREALEDVAGIEFMREASWARSAFWLSTILVDEASYGTDSRGLMRRLREAGVQSRPLWQPLHRSPAHSGAAALGGSVAEELNRRALSLPSSVGLEEEAQRRVIDLVREGSR